MKKSIIAAALAVTVVSTSVFAAAYTDQGRFGVGISTSGMGMVSYSSNMFDISATVANSSDDAARKTETTNYGVSGQLKSRLSAGTYGTYGLAYSGKSGKDTGTTIGDNYVAALTVGVQRELSDNVVLEAKMNPITFSSLKTGSATVVTTSLLSGGTVAVSYLF